MDLASIFDAVTPFKAGPIDWPGTKDGMGWEWGKKSLTIHPAGWGPVRRFVGPPGMKEAVTEFPMGEEWLALKVAEDMEPHTVLLDPYPDFNRGEWFVRFVTAMYRPGLRDFFMDSDERLDLRCKRERKEGTRTTPSYEPMREGEDIISMSHQLVSVRSDRLDLMSMAMKMMAQEGVKFYYMDHQRDNLRAILWGNPLSMPDQMAALRGAFRNRYVAYLKVLKKSVVAPSKMRRDDLNRLKKIIEDKYQPVLKDLKMMKKGLPRTAAYRESVEMREKELGTVRNKLLAAIGGLEEILNLDMTDEQIDEYLGFKGLSEGLNIF